MPLPEAIDFLVVSMSHKSPEKLAFYALLATLGSVAGCLFLYFIAARGGHTFLENRLGKKRAAKLKQRFEKYEFATLMITSMLPPPTPFKAFILTAGVMEVSPWTFATAIGLGRFLRYMLEGYLAIRYGDAVLEWAPAHGKQIGLAVLALVLAVTLGVLIRKKISEPAPDHGT